MLRGIVFTQSSSNVQLDTNSNGSNSFIIGRDSDHLSHTHEEEVCTEWCNDTSNSFISHACLPINADHLMLVLKTFKSTLTFGGEFNEVKLQRGPCTKNIDIQKYLSD